MVIKSVPARVGITVCIVLATVVVGARAQERKPVEVRLPRALDTFVKQELEPAYETGNPLTILGALRQQLPRLRETQIEPIDQALEDRGLPTLAGMLGEAHLAAARANVDSTEDMSLNEARLTIGNLRDEIQRQLADVSALRLMKDPLPLPQSLDEFHEVLWTAQLRMGELQAAKDRARLGQSLTEKVSTKARLVSNPQHKEILTTDFSAYQSQIDDLTHELNERALELRVSRIEFAVKTLLQEKDLKRRLTAAGALAIESEQLIETIKAGQGKFHRQSLNDPSLLNRLATNIQQGERLAGDLIKKSELLFGGLHWWLRGRYGRGVKFYGLVKADQAKHDPGAQNYIYMPKELPSADKTQLSRYDYPDRRHYYDWMWEERTLMVRQLTGTTQLTRIPNDRRKLTTIPQPKTQVQRRPAETIQRVPRRPRYNPQLRGGYARMPSSAGYLLLPSFSVGLYERSTWTKNDIKDLYKRLGYDPPPEPTKTMRKPEPTPGTTPNQPTYIQTYIPPLDPATIYQLVGFTEYGQALKYLDELIQLCNEQELKAISELISEKGEYTVEVNLSRTVEQPSSLSEERRDAQDDFKRRGLEWVTALARVEVAAMLVGFADLDDAFTRFAIKYDIEAYKELLADGMRTHYWSLKKDPQLQQVLAGKANANRTLAYARRVKLAQAFLMATAQSSRQQQTQRQRAELNAWKLNLDNSQAIIAKRLADFHETVVQP